MKLKPTTIPEILGERGVVSSRLCRAMCLNDTYFIDLSKRVKTKVDLDRISIQDINPREMPRSILSERFYRNL